MPAGRIEQSRTFPRRSGRRTSVAVRAKSRARARCRSRRGFTLIELLVVTSIIGILTSILLPAVQQAREAARRTECKNNLRQLAVAATNFESLFGCYPAGSDLQMTGPLVSLLPYFDQKDYYDEFSFDRNYIFWFKNPANRPPTQTTDFFDATVTPPRPPERYGAEGPIPMLICPSAPPSEANNTVMLMILRGTPFKDFTPGPYSTNFNILCGSPGSQVLTRSYYGAVGGDWFFKNGLYKGIFQFGPNYGPNANGTRVGAIHDGLENVLLFGETAGAVLDQAAGFDPPIRSTFCIGTNQVYFTDGINDTGYGNTFGSNHQGVVHFVYASGRVAAINYIQSVGAIGNHDANDTQVYMNELNQGPLFLNLLRLGGINDGELANAL